MSLQSGGEVAKALRAAGHNVTEADVMPDDLSAVEDAKTHGIDVVFPVLHGPWGEGGPLQAVLEASGLPYVGCRQGAAARCMDKWATKRVARELGIPTAEAELLTSPAQSRTVKAPVVIKAIDEGSSFGMAICQTEAEADAAVADLLSQYRQVMAERYIVGDELTVGVLVDTGGSPTALPVIKIVPAVAFYDYEAKYTRDDTQYLFDAEPPAVLDQVQRFAEQAFAGLGCRHLARIDFMLDADQRPWLLEANTMPGFTSHSLVPKAAAEAGVPFPELCDKLVRMALAD